MADPTSALVDDHDRFVSDGTYVGDNMASFPSASTFVGSPNLESPAGQATPPVIPPDHPSRTLVLCFDGTGDQFDSDNSNIVELFSMLKKGDHTKQMVYYQAGIGTYTTPQIATPLMSKMSKTLDAAVAWNLDAHVMSGYEFLMQNYTTGDRICIFGFSRGAYTARSLAGMIHKVGILPACNHQQVPFAYKMYTRTDEIGWKQSNAFKKAFSIDADIEFIGVWDTVDSVGIIPRRLPFTTSNTIVRTFRHAVALDERRAKFKANLWNRPNTKEQTLSVTDQEVHTAKKTGETDHHHEGVGRTSRKHSQHILERAYSKDPTQPTDVEEVWFAGCHCDIGGGSVENDTQHSLARIPLRWMIRECFKTSSGIMFDSEGLRKIGLNPDALYPKVLPRPPPLAIDSESFIQSIPAKAKIDKKPCPSQNRATEDSIIIPVRKTEEEMELADALSPIYDQLSLKWFWWVLELLPMKHRHQRSDTSWASLYKPNWGDARVIPGWQKQHGVKVHRSVDMRRKAKYQDGSKYQPKAELPEDPIWVD